jgi:hypothetical protein
MIPRTGTALVHTGQPKIAKAELAMIHQQKIGASLEELGFG